MELHSSIESLAKKVETETIYALLGFMLEDVMVQWYVFDDAQVLQLYLVRSDLCG